MFEQLRNIPPATMEKLQPYLQPFRRIEVSAKTCLLREGEIARKFYWIEQGCVRACFNNDGADITFQFFFEHTAVASIESFRKNIASLIAIETIEPCILYCADKQDVEALLAAVSGDPQLRELLLETIFERTFDYMKHFLSFIRDTPQQRYERLLQERPELVRRVPQHYIASYLGISSVHLSRIKSRIAKGK